MLHSLIFVNGFPGCLSTTGYSTSFFHIYIYGIWRSCLTSIIFFKPQMRYPLETLTRLETFDLKYYFVKYKFHEEMKIKF